LTGDDVHTPLRSALEKLESGPSDRIGSRSRSTGRKNLELLRRAAASGEVVEIEYLGAHAR